MRTMKSTLSVPNNLPVNSWPLGIRRGAKGRPGKNSHPVVSGDTRLPATNSWPVGIRRGAKAVKR
jgi:hypothetical protein